MKENLYKAFTSYINLVTNRLGGVNFTTKKKVSKNKILIPAFNKSFYLRAVVEKIEASEEFHTLVSVFCGDPSKNYESKYSVSIPRSVIINFFRRSKIYTQIADNKLIDIDKEFELLNTYDKEKEIRTITFRLIDDIRFPEKLIDFGTFKIQKFSQEELEKLTDNEINKNFYPYAVLETDKLQYYWFIVEESKEKKSGAYYSNIYIDLKDYCRVSRTFPDRSLQLLSLADWGNFRKSERIEEDLGWIDFLIPLSFRINNDIFESPFHAPDLSPLDFFPICDSEGNEIGEAPQFNIHIDENKLEKIKKIIKEAQVLIDIDLSECNWEFIERAMGYLAKAFFASDELEQLMWHMTVLEVLLGEKENVIDKVRSRLSIIFGQKDEKKIEEIRKIFNKLYDFRSGLVHGRPLLKKKKQKKIYLGHLRIAREYARKTILWYYEIMLYIHSQFQKKGISVDRYPNRDKLLTLIDFQIQFIETEKGKIYLSEGFPSIINHDHLNI